MGLERFRPVQKPKRKGGDPGSIPGGSTILWPGQTAIGHPGHPLWGREADLISYDELTGRIIDLRQTQDQTNFEAGDLCWYAVEKLGIEAGTIAADTGYSAQHIKDLARTSKVFHSAGDRRAREYVQWSHYKIAARTDDPVGWIDRAEAAGWSTRELQRQITGEPERDPLAGAQRAFRQVEKVVKGGGEGAEWLITQLAAYLSQLPGSENGERDLIHLPGLTASIAGPRGLG